VLDYAEGLAIKRRERPERAPAGAGVATKPKVRMLTRRTAA